MSDASSKTEQTGDEVPENPLAKAFFDKLRKDGPKRDKIGQSFVRHFSQPAVNPLKEQTSHTEDQDQPELADDWEEALSPARRFRQTRVEIIKLKQELDKEIAENKNNMSDKEKKEEE